MSPLCPADLAQQWIVIEAGRPIDRSRQTLFGHSLGGWFVLYTFFISRPAFHVYAAGSPSIWWKQSCILPYAERLAMAGPEAESGAGSTALQEILQEAQQESGRKTEQNPQQKLWRETEQGSQQTQQNLLPNQQLTRLYLGVGSQEKPHMVADASRLYELLAAADLPWLRLQYRCLEEEDHLSVIQPLLR